MSNFPELQTVHTLIFDFDGVFTNNKVYVSEDGKETIACSRYDGFGFNLLRKFQAKGLFTNRVMVLSKEPNPVVLARTKKLKLDCVHGIDDKLTYLETYFKQQDITDPFSGLVYVGNDLNDLAVMRRASFSVAPADAHPVIKEVADVVLSQNGGEGFVRAFIENLLRIDTLSLDEIEDLVK